ncbi:MAG: hypothetical protein M0P32_04050 [Bacteroidales bacterium]|nr:hypothetical protein [Bacteroidales bacterium]
MSLLKDSNYINQETTNAIYFYF